MNLLNILKYSSLIVLILVSSSCGRYEGFSDCTVYPIVTLDDVVDDVHVSVNTYKAMNPMASQIQMQMGSQGVTNCKFTGL